MDPNTGRLYGSFDAAKLAGVVNPVEIIATEADALRISDAVARVHSAEQKAKKKARRKEVKKSRKANRG